MPLGEGKYLHCKKSLKITKGYSESVNRRTDNTMAKRKGTKAQTAVYKTQHIKLEIELYEPTTNRG